MNHTVTKFIRDYGEDYFCEEHNTSYPSKKSLAEEHDMGKTVIKVMIKRSFT